MLFLEALCVLEPEETYNFQTLVAIYIEMSDAKSVVDNFNYALQLEVDQTPTLINMCKAPVMADRKDEAVRLAEILSKEMDPKVANTARAIILAYF